VKKRIVKTAFERLHQIKANVLGVVINDLDRKRVGASYYYDYNRYGGDYYNNEKKSPKPRNSPAVPNQQAITHNQPTTTHNQIHATTQQSPKITIIKPPAP
jgi:Mrp family chromosome partitioning ATPase